MEIETADLSLLSLRNLRQVCLLLVSPSSNNFYSEINPSDFEKVKNEVLILILVNKEDRTIIGWIDIYGEENPLKYQLIGGDIIIQGGCIQNNIDQFAKKLLPC
jgi:hypothetical protein